MHLRPQQVKGLLGSAIHWKNAVLEYEQIRGNSRQPLNSMSPLAPLLIVYAIREYAQFYRCAPGYRHKPE